jgi:uncharacterized protein involved in type VI secretion and phage assembly
MHHVDPRSPVVEQGAARWYGVYPATVTDVRDPDKQGRVEVELLFVPTVSGQTFKAWARVATLMAGKDRGSLFTPEPEDEVLVAFHAGDPSHPYVIGAVWNGKDTPPSDRDDSGQNNIRVLKTRSGHKLVFDDTDGAAKITLTTPNGSELTLDDAGGGTVRLEHSSGSYLEMDASGGITLHATSQLTFDAPTLTANVQMSDFSGVTQHQAVITPSVVGSSYTPGAGNLW